MAQSDPDYQIKCQIIQEVQLRPLLYNKGHPKYQINSCRTEEFAHIGVSVEKQVSKHRSSQEHVDLFMCFAWNN